MIAKIDCKEPLSGRLVTQEEKERMLKRRNQILLSDERVEPSIVGSDNCSNELSDGHVTISNILDETIDTEFTVMSSDNESDSVMLLQSNDHALRPIFSRAYVKRFFKAKANDYYHWFLLLFKNKWWRTTLLLWYLW